MDLGARAANAVGDTVDDDVAVVDAVVGQTRADAAQHCADAGLKLGHRKRLGQIVISAGVEATDPVALLAPGCQHDDGQVSGLGPAADAAADLDARQLGQHPVQQHQVRRALVDLEHPLLAVRGDDHAIALLLQIVLKQGRKRVLVFHHQDIRLHVGLSVSGEEVRRWVWRASTVRDRPYRSSGGVRRSSRRR